MTHPGRNVDSPADDRTSPAGLLIMLGSGTSNQVGAAVGTHAFPAVGPAGVVAVRQIVAAVVLLVLARPRFWRFRWAQWWPVLLLAGVFAVMNLSLYTAIDRIGLGLAVTLEFLGPLAVALAGSRSRIDLLCALGAGVGVYVLVLPGPSSDYVGLALALLAAGCWAAYIVLNRLIGTRLSGLQAPAVATSVSAIIYLPLLVALFVQGRFVGASLLYAVGAGVLSSAVPYAIDLLSLRRVSTQFFGVFMSVNPVLAALAGIVVLDQLLGLHQWLGIAIVVVVNAVAVLTKRRPERPTRTVSRQRAGAASLSQDPGSCIVQES